MEGFQWLSLIISCLAVVVSILAYTDANKALRYLSAQVANDVRRSVRDAYREVCRTEAYRTTLRDEFRTEGGYTSDEQLDADKENLRWQSAQKQHRDASREYLLALNDACGQFLDGNLDEERFKRMYCHEIDWYCGSRANGEVPRLLQKREARFGDIWRVYEQLKSYRRYDEP